MHFLDWNKLFHTEVINYYQEQADKRLDNFLRPKWERYLNIHEENEQMGGDVIVNNLRKCLRSGMGITRSETQWKVHEGCIKAMAPKIYGEEWKLNQARILTKFRTEEIVQQVIIIMSRRQGKSFSVGMFVASALLNIPGVRIAVWATAERLAQALMEIVKNMLERAFRVSYDKSSYPKSENNKTRYSFFGPDGTERILLCLPGTPRVSIASLFRN